MRGTVLYGARDIRFEDRPEPQIQNPTDHPNLDHMRVRFRLVAVQQPMAMGHEYCGIVEEVGSAVKTVKKGQFVVGSYFGDLT